MAIYIPKFTDHYFTSNLFTIVGRANFELVDKEEQKSLQSARQLIASSKENGLDAFVCAKFVYTSYVVFSMCDNGKKGERAQWSFELQRRHRESL